MSTASKKKVKVWKAYLKWGSGIKDEYVVESFDVIETPTRYNLSERLQAFRFSSQIDKKTVSLTREEAIARLLSKLEESLKVARQHVIEITQHIEKVKAL